MLNQKTTLEIRKTKNKGKAKGFGRQNKTKNKMIKENNYIFDIWMLFFNETKAKKQGNETKQKTKRQNKQAK